MLDSQDRNEAQTFMPEDEHIGKLIQGKYRILTLIGAGGMVKTYLAENEHSDHLWSIEAIKKDLNIQSILQLPKDRRAACSRIRHRGTILCPF